VSKQRWLGAVVLLAACGGGVGPAQIEPANTAKGAVNRFMEAVADSNLTQMGNLWGTAAGAAARTNQPADWERRIAIMRAYLQNESHRVVSDTPDGSDSRHAVQVELRRQLCTWVVPFSVIKTSDGNWLVNQVDLAAAGNPARPCVPGGQQDSTAQQDSTTQQ
jgi:hypothetical protein